MPLRPILPSQGPFPRRDPLAADLGGGGGNVAIVGAARSGKSALLRTLICALALTHSPREVQFFCLELFFRGWMVGALRRAMGSAAIFVMALPYCMIHYGKPYLEAHGAIVAGVVLGSLAMRTRSIYAGFLLHITVAAGMDLLSLYKRGALPTNFWPQ